MKFALNSDVRGGGLEWGQEQLKLASNSDGEGTVCSRPGCHSTALFENYTSRPTSMYTNTRTPNAFDSGICAIYILFSL